MSSWFDRNLTLRVYRLKNSYTSSIFSYMLKINCKLPLSMIDKHGDKYLYFCQLFTHVGAVQGPGSDTKWVPHDYCRVCGWRGLWCQQRIWEQATTIPHHPVSGHEHPSHWTWQTSKHYSLSCDLQILTFSLFVFILYLLVRSIVKPY